MNTENEDEKLIKKIVNDPERRIFKIDVGNLPKCTAEEYVKNLMQKYRQRKFFDPKTGDVSGDHTMIEDYDYWIPV